MTQKLTSLRPDTLGADASAGPQPTAASAITTADVNTAQSVSQMLLTLTKSHPPNIGMGALIMATSLAAREMNIPQENIAAMIDRTIAEVYASGRRGQFAATVN